jgi:hypothetical protein
MFSIEERYNFYTNCIFNNNEKYNFNIPNKYKNHKQNDILYTSVNTKNDYYFRSEIKNKNINSYLTIEDDGYENNDLPCFQKTRKIKDHSKFSILHKLQFGRHWGPFYDINNKDNISWDNKINEIIWRGASTGNDDRINFTELYYKKYNVGLWCVLKHLKHYEYLVKPEIKINDFYKYKYIVSIEGNDKDSGINWKLASNSVVLMKPPTFESWLMESYLQPYVHYVPLNDNFSNLEEIYQWCLNNDEKCQEIVKNANLFMDNFRNVDMELELINKIELDYFNNIQLNLIE